MEVYHFSHYLDCLIYLINRILSLFINIHFLLFDNAATTIPCANDHDCDEVFNCIRMCIDGFCDYVVMNL